MQHSRSVPQNLIVPEPKHAIALYLEHPAASGISVLIRSMVPAVDLDDEPRLCAAEVHDIRPDRVLTAELETTETPIAEEHPHSPLGIRLRVAQLPRVRS